jgi:hypothetical protein
VQGGDGLGERRPRNAPSRIPSSLRVPMDHQDHDDGTAGGDRSEARAADHLELTEDGRRRVAAAASSTVAAAREWQRTHRWPEPGTWEREYAPLVPSLSVVRVVRATGLSEAYCRRIKRGEVVPHPMWWEAVRKV